MKKLDFIQKFIEMGIAVMPLRHRSKEPILATWRDFQNRLPTHTEYKTWFPTDWNNYAVIAGWNNLVVIDFDNFEYFDIWKLWCASNNTQYATAGFQVRTRKGMHVYLQTETPAANDKRISKSAGIDVQAQGRFVVGPLCTHPTGHIYEPLGEMIFPVVPNIESVLPLDLFPRVRQEQTTYIGNPVQLTPHTEYVDPLVDTRDLISKVKGMTRIETFYAGIQKSSVDNQWFKALCPFHNDKHQSAWIDTVHQVAGCQVCNMKPMDSINVYARMHNISDRDAVAALAAEIGVWA